MPNSRGNDNDAFEKVYGIWNTLQFQTLCNRITLKKRKKNKTNKLNNKNNVFEERSTLERYGMIWKLNDIISWGAHRV